MRRRTAIFVTLLPWLVLSGHVASASCIHEVAPGETLGGIADRYGCSVADLRNINGIDGDLLSVGQSIGIPAQACDEPSHATCTHRVASGQTLASIAKRYATSVEAIREANDLDGHVIHPDQKIAVPTGSWDGPREGPEVREHEVSSGETLGKIAQRYGCRVATVRRANGIDGNLIHPGQTLEVPEDCDEGATMETHHIEAGESLKSIAAQHGCTIGELKQANDKDGTRIFAGHRLKIPHCDGTEQNDPELVSHTVMPGETLGHIAQRYGTSVSSIKERNSLEGHLINVGDELEVRSRVPVRRKRRFVYRVQAGDTCGGIAQKFEMTLEQVRSMNPEATRDDCRYLRPKDTLTLFRTGPEDRSKTVGRAYEGKLVDGEQLPPGPGYNRARPSEAWGTNETITHLLDAIATVRREHPHVHDVMVGDISDRDGGPLPPHTSHQSGRDVDLGFYVEDPPGGGAFPNPVTRHELDEQANWTLIEALVGDDESEAVVEYIFLHYELQKELYEWAEDNGVSERQLDRIFQYPAGKHAGQGMIRHEPGHDDHYHIRFECPGNECG